MNQVIAPHSFTRSGRTVTLNHHHGDVIPHLEPGVYILLFSHMTGFYLDLQDPILVPPCLYGSTNDRASKILHTFTSRPDANTGVLLTGNKGSGKTLLAKTVCDRAVKDLSMPVILIEESYEGPDFVNFINSISQQCIIFIDEFEKKYVREDNQNALLGILDGTGTSRKLFLLTSNKAEISPFFMSRPSRIFYHWSFGKLEEEVLIGYCKEHLKNGKHMENMHTLWTISSDISFDVMQALVEEINRYPDQDFLSLISDMNVSLGDALSRTYVYDEVFIDGVKYSTRNSCATINVVDAHSGTALLSVPLNIGKWDVQKSLYRALGRSGCFFYNHDVLAQEEDDSKNGVVQEEGYYDNRIDDDFNILMRIDPTVDEIKTDSIIINHKYGPHSIKMKMSVSKANPITTYFSRLFK